MITITHRVIIVNGKKDEDYTIAIFLKDGTPYDSMLVTKQELKKLATEIKKHLTE